ncbi:MAG: DsbA family protein [Candidatus Nanoarchaeia archaeon]
MTKEQDKTLVYLTILQVVLVCIITFQVAGISSTLTALTDGAAVAPTQPSQPGPAAPAARVDVSADDDAVKGDKDAPVEIFEFSDFQCPFCQRFYKDTLPQLQKNYIDTGKVKLIYRDFPLSIHPLSHKAAEAAECAGEQGKYWDYHNELFDNQQRLSSDIWGTLASNIDLDMTKFNTCLSTDAQADEVDKDFADGRAAGVTGTPAFFINGKLLVGAQPYAAFQQVIDAELK